MVIRKAFKYRLKTKSHQSRLLSKAAGSCRFVWNKALTLQKERMGRGDKCLLYYDMSKLLTGWKLDHPFLKETSAMPLQQTLINFDRALKDAFDKTSPKQFPVFKKKKDSSQAFRFPKDFKIQGNKIYLPKLGWFVFFKSRKIEGTVKSVSVSCHNKHWYVSVHTEKEIEDPVHPSNSIVGGDRGIKYFLTLSDGSFYEPVNPFRTKARQLAREQRKLARKSLRSNNWYKQKCKVVKLHKQISNTRNDYLHKISTEVSKNHAVVILEDLKVSNMAAKGINKKGLNKSILDQGWYEFKRQLEYKLLWRGGRLLVVPPAYTSQQCSRCGHISRLNRLSQSKFACVACGSEFNADHNAAINIARAGHAQLACQANGDSMPSATGTLFIWDANCAPIPV